MALKCLILVYVLKHIRRAELFHVAKMLEQTRLFGEIIELMNYLCRLISRELAALIIHLELVTSRPHHVYNSQPLVSMLAWKALLKGAFLGEVHLIAGINHTNGYLTARIWFSVRSGYPPLTSSIFRFLT